MVTKQELVVVRQKVLELKPELMKVLPKAIPSERFIRTVLTALTLNPGIAEASQKSILASCLKAASDGLELDGREAALVVYRSKAGPIAQYLPMIYGIIKKVRQSGDVSVLNAFVVCENDEYTVEFGMEPKIHHIPALKGPRGKPEAVYAVCRFKDGTADLETMTYDDVERIRSRSKAKNSGPWVTDWDEMAKKTVIRRLAKRLPMSTDTMGMISRIDEMYDLQDGAEYEPTHRKKAGAGAAKLNEEEGEADLDVDPTTGAVIIEGETEVVEENPKPPTKAQKKAAAAKKKADDAVAAAEKAAKEAEDEERSEEAGEKNGKSNAAKEEARGEEPPPPSGADGEGAAASEDLI